MTYKNRIALVTGGNRGIGKEICRQLAEKEVHVFLTARDRDKGEKAQQELKKSTHKIQFLQLDITDPASIQSARNEIEKRFGRLDILINNAAIFPENDQSIAKAPTKILRATLETNLIGSVQVTQEFIHLLKMSANGRIVNLSSGMGALNEMGVGHPAYRISKTALNAFTRILALELSGSGILVNSMCPGWVRTNMGGSNATRSVEKGAETAVWLALLPPGGTSGGFYRDKQKIAW